MKSRELYRTQIEILVDILRATTEPSLKTHIMFKAKLKHDTLNTYLITALEYRFIKRVKDGFLITDSGMRFLNFFREIESNGNV